MKTNRIYAVGEKAILELGFQKALDYPDEVWVRLCQKQYPDEKITKVVDAKTHHLCKYCGCVAKGTDDDVLCADCRELFGHAFFSEL